MAIRSILSVLLLGLMALAVCASTTTTINYTLDRNSNLLVNYTEQYTVTEDHPSSAATSIPMRHSTCTSTTASVTAAQLAAGVSIYSPPIHCSSPRLQLVFFAVSQKAVDSSILTTQGTSNFDYIQDNGIFYFRSPVYSSGTILLKTSPREKQLIELDFADPQSVGAQLTWMSNTGLVSGLSAQDISGITAWLSNSSLDTTPGDCYNGSVQSCYIPNNSNSTLMWATYVPADRVQLLDNSDSDRALIGAYVYPQPGRLMALWGLHIPSINASASTPAERAFNAPSGGQVMVGNGSGSQSANPSTSGNSAGSAPSRPQPPTSPQPLSEVPTIAPSPPNPAGNPAPSNGGDSSIKSTGTTGSGSSGTGTIGSGTSGSGQNGTPASGNGTPSSGAGAPSTHNNSIQNSEYAAPALNSNAPSSPAPSQWPWWMAPAIVAALGAFFMGVMAFYYRQPSVLGPFETPTAQTEMAPPIYLSETRVALMEQISDTSRIPTDIASRLNKSKSTVVEQLEDLCTSGLAERQQTPGKKFVFYRLTKSGRHALVHSPLAKKKHSILPF